MKQKIALAMLMSVFLFAGVSAMPMNFGGDGEAWTNDHGNHYVNENNPDLRFDWTNHRIAVPGQGGMHANENAAIISWGEGSLVDPFKALG